MGSVALRIGYDPDMDEIGVGTLVRSRWVTLGLSSTRLAEMAGTSSPSLSQIEAGKTRLPGVDLRRRLADALGLTNLDLLVAAGEVSRAELGREHAGDPLPEDARVVARLVATLPSEDRRAVVALLERLVGAREESRAYALSASASTSDSVGSTSG